MSNTALVAGASGLVGGHCLKFLLEDNFFDTVKILVRSPIPFEHHKLIQIVVDYDQLQDFRLQMEATHTFCTLGTTIKKAGSQDAFRKVDFEYPLLLAKIMKSLGCENFSVVTALGSNANSPIFYNKVKGELENELRKIQFQQLQILQPSLLLGDRNESRMGEGIAQVFFKISKPIWQGPLKKYAGIEGEQVAKAMVRLAKQSSAGTTVYLSDELQDL